MFSLVEQRRKELGMPINCLAKRSKLSVKTVRKALKGQTNIRTANFLRILEVLGLRMVLSFEGKDYDF